MEKISGGSIMDILTLKEAADFLKLSERSIYRLLKEGKIPARKIMHKWRFEREQLKEWVRNDPYLMRSGHG
ncbi:MAG: helix-turn-helix domain-containing protein [Candidatus Omnitrophica bacterium]|nr:helix-turn-helix domain-containing protein [Candidatus Omnitrophota bacterium]